MSIFRPPESYTWGFVKLLFIASPLALIAMLAPSFIKFNYDVPPEKSLQYATGQLLSVKPSAKAPYRLREDAGQIVTFGCWPNATYANCLDNSVPTLTDLSRLHVRLGYFRRYNWSNSSLSNVIVTITDGDQVLQGYATGKGRIERWAERDRRAMRSPGVLIAAVWFPLASFAFAIWLAAAKKRIEQENNV